MPLSLWNLRSADVARVCSRRSGPEQAWAGEEGCLVIIPPVTSIANQPSTWHCPSLSSWLSLEYQFLRAVKLVSGGLVSAGDHSSPLTYNYSPILLAGTRVFALSDLVSNPHHYKNTVPVIGKKTFA